MGWHAGLSVLDGVHPAHLKSRERISAVIPERRRLAACLSAACSRRQRLAAIQERPLLRAKKALQGKKERVEEKQK